MSPILSARGGMSAGAYGWGALSAANPGFDSIATANGTGSSNTLTFSSIPSTYKHLQLRGILLKTGVANDGATLRINGISTTSYDWQYFEGSGSATPSGAASSNATSISFLGGMAVGSSSWAYSVVIIDILDYASTSKAKTIKVQYGQSNNSSGTVGYTSGLFRSTAAISSLTFTVASDNWTSDTTLALYGMKGAA